MATSVSVALALGNGIGGVFQELTATDYFRQPVTLTLPDKFGNTTNVYGITFTPSQPWGSVDQLGIYDACGVLLLWLNWSPPATLPVGRPTTIAPNRLSIQLPMQELLSGSVLFDTGKEIAGELAGSGTIAGVSFGADRILLHFNACIWINAT
jgi:hypothetical protein